jgi:hypothetical protein
MNNYSPKILDHEFAEESRKDAIPYMMELLGEKSYSPSELEEYSFTVMGWIHRLLNCFKALEHTRVYISHFMSNKWYREAGIVQSNYINYHYVKYAITVVTIMDVSLILTNYTLRLGNPEKLCYLDSIMRNSWVISSNIDKALNKLSRIVEQWREPRNLFIHRGWEIYREVLTALEGYELTQGKGKGMLFKAISSHRIKFLYKSELSKILKEFDQIETPLFDAVIELLSKLLPVYKSWRKKLQKPPLKQKPTAVNTPP